MENYLLPKLNKYIKQVPTPLQSVFLLQNDVLDVFYGGAAGGGKSSALLMAALQYVEIPGYSAVIIRDTLPNLIKPEGLMSRAHEWLDTTDAVWKDKKKQWVFPSGASLSFGYIDGPNDHNQYEGAAYQFVGIDEVVNIREHQALFLFSRMRRTKEIEASGVPIRFRAASNPPKQEQLERGEWVRKRYVDPTTRKKGAVFVPAKLTDNPHIDQASYIESLDQLDTITRNQLLHGDWFIQAQGGMFATKWFEVVDDCPKTGKCVRGWDLAGTDEMGAAYTCGVKIRRTDDGTFYIENVERFRGSPKMVEERIKFISEMDGNDVVIGLPQDPGQAGKYQINNYISLLAGYTVRTSLESGSKADRAAAISSQAEFGRVKLVKGLWIRDFLNEIVLFPFGKYKDQVDAMSRAFHTLLRLTGNSRVTRPIVVPSNWAHTPMGYSGLHNMTKHNIMMEVNSFRPRW